MTCLVVVHPPSPAGGRLVTADAQVLGFAYDERDVVEMLGRTRADLDSIDLDDPDLIEWRGVGRDEWI